MERKMREIWTKFVQRGGFKYKNPSDKRFSELHARLVKESHEGAIGAHFLVSYFAHQFRWFSTNYKKSSLISETLGLNKIDSFKNRESGHAWADSEYARKLGIYAEHFIEKPPIDWNLIKVHEEDVRQRHFNTPFGYNECITKTMLMNPASNFCQACKYAHLCKERLKVKLPHVYRARFEKDTTEENVRTEEGFRTEGQRQNEAEVHKEGFEGERVHGDSEDKGAVLHVLQGPPKPIELSSNS